jgi:flagellar hook-basal body complex protein FliE
MSSVEAIGGLVGLSAPSIATTTVDLRPMDVGAGVGSASGVAGDFETLLDKFRSLNTALVQSAVPAQQLALGQSDQIETVLLDLERVRVQFDFLMSVRNRLLESYQELMRMQI